MNHIRPYDDSMREAWDALVTRSKNGTFLLTRPYMEYHKQRFSDHSLVAVQQDQLLAVLPANRVGARIESHGGLTYGGWITDDTMTLPRMMAMWQAMMLYLRDGGFASILYKPVPHVYHRLPADEDLFCLHTSGARVVRRSPMTVVARHGQQRWQERRRRGARKARSLGIAVSESNDWPTYWTLLTEVLRTTYSATPVHTLDEITYLKSQYPMAIRLFVAEQQGRMVAGVVIFETSTVARAQYIAADEAGKSHSALDLLFDRLLNELFATKRFFDLGTSDGSTGAELNTSLLEFKEGFGGRTIIQDTYELAIAPD